MIKYRTIIKNKTNICSPSCILCVTYLFIDIKIHVIMLEYAVFEGGPFLENTYIVSDETRDCIIIDPGCSNPIEEKQLLDYIEVKCLKPTRLINTHCHIDHVLGNAFISKRFGLLPEYHEIEKIVMDSCEMVAANYHIPYNPSPKAEKYLEVPGKVEFGNTELELRFTPGHSPGSVVLISHEHKTIFAGDVLFQGSIGRTDLPGGDFATLEKSIREQLYTLDNEYKVFPGHGPETSIGFEKANNPFVSVKV